MRDVIPEKYGTFDNNGFLCIESDKIIQTLSYLKCKLNFQQLIDITAFNGTKKNIVYTLRNLSEGTIVHVLVSDDGSVKSITSLFPNAELYECEIYEKFNIIFINHPRLLPIFTHETPCASILPAH